MASHPRLVNPPTHLKVTLSMSLFAKSATSATGRAAATKAGVATKAGIAATARWVFALACVSALTPAAAQTAPKPQPVWEWGATGFGQSAPAYPGAKGTNSSGLVLPWVIYRGDFWRADGSTVGARLLKTDDVEFDLGFAAALGASSKDVAARVGMPDLGFQFEFGPRVKLTVARPDPQSRIRLDLPVRAVMESKGGINQRGLSLEPRVMYERRTEGGSVLDLSASTLLGSQKYGNFLYGVPTAFQTASRAAYTGKGGLITMRLQGTLLHSVTPSAKVFGYVRLDSLAGAANRASPLVERTSGASVGGGLIWTLGQSEAMTAN
jgi:MipA family protein